VISQCWVTGGKDQNVYIYYTPKPFAMTSAAKSVCYFGFYLYVVGLTLIFLPNLFLQTLQLPSTNEVWIRIVGILAFNIGYYYHRTGMTNNYSFFKLTVPTRILVFISFTVFALLKYTSPVLIAIGAVDLAGALWTWMALKNAPQNAPADTVLATQIKP
jgi:hypothetical protein